MATTYSREIFNPGMANWMRDMLRQGTLYPEPTYFDEDAARRQFLYELMPEQIEMPAAQSNSLKDLLDPKRRLREQGLD